MNSGYISVVGRSNVGKSTIVNCFVGEKVAAVSPRPQTTRNRIIGVRTAERGQIVFVDTPGIHKPYNKMHKRMVALALESIAGIDALLLVVDCSEAFGAGDRYVLGIIKDSGKPCVLALNKIDKIKKPALLPLLERYAGEMEFEALVPISALRGDGMDALEGEILECLPRHPLLFPEDYLTDQTDRVLAAEIIREKVFINTRSEVPYCSAVLIDAFREEEKQIFIAAGILVERASQKAIVIGRGGSMLKRIGSDARAELETLLNTRVYLDLFVKVRGDWRENDRILKELGLGG